MNNVKHNEGGVGSITTETKTASTKSECESTMPKWAKRCPKCNCVQVYATKRILTVAIQKRKVCSKCRPRKEKILVIPPEGWTRRCDCGRILHYTCKGSLTLAIKRNRKCNACSHPITKGPRVTWSNFKRNCPACGKEMFYSTEGSLRRAIKRNTDCLSCLRKGENNVMYGETHTLETRERLRAVNLGKHPAKETRKKMSLHSARKGVHQYGKDANFYGKHHTEEWKRKMRVMMCRRLLKLRPQGYNGGWINNVGKKEGSYFKKLEARTKWNGIYHKKSGKQHLIKYLGYFVDYYEPLHNIVVEYDEPRHYRYGRLREKDLVRMEQIKAHLGCEFWRYDAYRKQLWKA